MSEPRDPQKAVDFILQSAGEFAKAKAERVYLEEFRKSKKALLMRDSESASAAMQERDAYAHPDYLALLDGIKAAVEREEVLRWQLVAAQARVEVWRTQCANDRSQDRTMR